MYVPPDVTRATATSLPDDPAALRAELLRVIDERDAALAQRDDAVRKLRLHLAKRFGPRAEALDAAQLALFADEVKAIEAKAEADSVTVAGHTRRKHGPKPLPANLPRETKINALSAEERACPCCSKERVQIDHTTHEVLEIEPAKFKIIVYVTPIYSCVECRGQEARAPAPTLPLPKSYAGASLLAHVAVSKFADHCPLYRQEGMLARSGLDLWRSTMCGWMLGCAELLAPLTEMMRREVLASTVVQSDDTTVPTLGLVKGKAKDARLWAFVGDRLHRYAVFDYTTSREGKWPQTWLKDFRGYLQTDAFAGYAQLHGPGGAREVGCWAHARRGFFDAKDLAPGFCLDVLREIAKLYAVEKDATERGLSPSERKALREESSRPQLERVFGLLESERETHVPKSAVRIAVEYVLTRREAFTRYLDDGLIEIDNNACERCMRSPALGRKNWLFAGSADGGRAIAAWLSVIQSARLHEVEPFAYVSDLLTRLAEYRDLAAERKAADGERLVRELLPDAWIKSNPSKRLALAR
jgi:transposase